MDDAEKRAEQLLSELDTAAREVDHYEYGLPIYGEDRADLVEMAAKAIREAVAAERERCAQVADNFAAGADAVIAAEGHSWCPQCHEYTRNVADDIAQAIRQGVSAKPAPAPARLEAEHGECVTVAAFKMIVQGWPEVNHLGEPTEVWAATGWCLSSPVVSVGPLNLRTGDDGKPTADMLLATAQSEESPAKPAPAWSKMHPMQPGWYWLRLVTYGGVTTTQAVEVDWYDDPGGKLWCDDGMVHEIQGQWFGPIEVPA